MLTDSKLKALKPKDKLYKVTDRDGMYVAVRPSGRIVFRFDYRFGGKRQTITIGKYGDDGISLSEARDNVIKFRKMIASGENPADALKNSVEDGPTSIVDVAEMYIKSRPLRKNSVVTYSTIINVHLRNIPECYKAVSALTSADINAIINCLTRASTADSHKVFIFSFIKTVCRYAASIGHEVPMRIINASLPVKSDSRPRERFLTPTEIHKVFSNLRQFASDTYYDALMLILYNGNRKSEIFSLRWGDINFDNATITIPGSRMKNGEEHTIYLSKQSMEILQARTRVSEFVFFQSEPGRTNNPIAGVIFREIYTTLDVPHFTVHDIRRTVATLLYELGYNEDLVEPTLAHTRKGIRKVYDLSRQAKKRRRMMQAWADQVDRWIAGEELDIFEDEDEE
ncbi:tyrosine-type recombinase/integrase [Gallibacterium anatis]|uniref:tyrosine-type recombinase/integrase n=1 Tax=Gallibacterium anatis TaxID=750 RepID=UPI0030073EB6